MVVLCFSVGFKDIDPVCLFLFVTFPPNLVLNFVLIKSFVYDLADFIINCVSHNRLRKLRRKTPGKEE